MFYEWRVSFRKNIGRMGDIIRKTFRIFLYIYKVPILLKELSETF